MAGLPWIKVWTVIGAHPKVQRLEKVLGVRDALGVVVRLWCWTAEYHPGGDIPEDDIDAAAKVARGEVTRRDVIAAMCEVGFLDATPTGYRVHDWADMQTRHVEAEEKRKAQARDRQRRHRERNGDVTRDVTRDVTDDVTVTVTQSNAGDKKERREEGEKIDHDRITTTPLPSISSLIVSRGQA